MVDFTLNRTVEDHDNEQYALAYNADDIARLEKDTALGEAFSAWRTLAPAADKAPPAAAFRAFLKGTPTLAARIHAVHCLVSGDTFSLDDKGREALRQIGIEGQLDLTAQALNNRAFAGFLFFAGSGTSPSYQRVCEINNGVRREYARLALPVDDGSGSLAYFMIRPLSAAETPLEKITELAELNEADA
tara:strand:- start:54 stop:620 length:567 start_codon:yes stop_codon:yes gene_type:complete